MGTVDRGCVKSRIEFSSSKFDRTECPVSHDRLSGRGQGTPWFGDISTFDTASADSRLSHCNIVVHRSDLPNVLRRSVEVAGHCGDSLRILRMANPGKSSPSTPIGFDSVCTVDLSHYKSRTRHWLSSIIITARGAILRSGIQPSTDRFREYSRVVTSCAIPTGCSPSRPLE